MVLFKESEILKKPGQSEKAAASKIRPFLFVIIFFR